MEREKKRAGSAKKSAGAAEQKIIAIDVLAHRRLALSALFVVSAAGLIFEITLTRLFSLFFQYHFTFLAVSLAILGLSLGAASAFYLKPQRSLRTLAAVLVALSITLSLATLIIAWLPSADTIFPRALVALVPFFLIGLYAALTYENFASAGGTFYAADLIGAAVGVVAVLGLLYIWSAFSMVLFLAALIGLIAVVFVLRSLTTVLLKVFAGLSLALGIGLLAINLISGVVDFNPMQLTGFTPDKTMLTILQDATQLGKIIYTAWSPFSRVDVVQTGDHSSRYIFADGGAGAYMMAWDGSVKSLDAMPITHSIDALPFVSGNDNKTLIVGAGGGKDILLALHANATAITALEVNPAIIAATRAMGDYNGHVLDLPQVNLVEGDARSFAERTTDQYDAIYMNLVYTQAVEPASQTLVENYIFTTEAFQTFLNKLAPDGRLMIVAHNGIEGSRAMVTALQAMQNMGIAPKQALDHLWLWKENSDDPTTAETVLIVSKAAFSTDTLQTLKTAALAQSMSPLYSPVDYETLFQPLRNGTSLSNYIQSDASYNLAPTDDDSPYFYDNTFGLPPAVQSALILSALLAIGLVAVAFFTEAENREALRQRRGWVIYAALIGIGFMLIEVPLIQRFQLLLGEPILSLAAVLATLLLSGGVGSLISQRWPTTSVLSRVRIIGAAILVLSLIYWVGLPPLVESLLSASFVVRLLAIIVLTAILGVPMGMPFPSLMRLAGGVEQKQEIALLWAINGAFSVLGSVLAMVISMQAGFKWALLIGAALYLLLAALTWLIANRQTKALA